MPRNDEGEFELVLGNKQLLSVFFIVVILIGVFFTMGYIVGRNSGPAVNSVAGKQTPTDSTALNTPGQNPAGAPVTTESSVPPAQTQPAAGVPGQAQLTQPDTTVPETAEASKPKKVSEEIGEQDKKKPEKIKRPDPKTFLMAKVAPGQTYLQVAAVKRPEAELLASVLRRKGFIQAVVVQGPKEDLFRVLVGPVKDREARQKTKADLEAAGFKSIVQTY
jgi:cell division septation protein DedD